MNTDSLRYAGFGPRLAANLLDFVIMIPLIALSFWGSSYFRLFEVYYFLPGIVFGLFFSVYLVRRYGGTPGKLLVGRPHQFTNRKSLKPPQLPLRNRPGLSSHQIPQTVRRIIAPNAILVRIDLQNVLWP